MQKLFPTFDTPQTVEEANEAKNKNAFKPSIYFDEQLGDFRRNGAGQLQTANGYEAWKQWCINTVQTERYACLGYSQNYGVEIERVFLKSDRVVAESLIQQTIEEALLADPAGRTRGVTDFTFDWQGDSVLMNCTVTSVSGDKANIDVMLGKGGTAQ